MKLMRFDVWLEWRDKTGFINREQHYILPRTMVCLIRGLIYLYQFIERLFKRHEKD